MSESNRQKPRTQTQPDMGSGGRPPRPTAIGTSGSGDDGNFNIGETLGCVVIGTFPGGYIVELDVFRASKIKNLDEFFLHAVLMSNRDLNLGDRTLGRLAKIKENQFVLDDSVLGEISSESSPVDPTLPTSGTRAFAKVPSSEWRSEKMGQAQAHHELELIPEARPSTVQRLELPSITAKQNLRVSDEPIKFLHDWRLPLNDTSLIFDSSERLPIEPTVDSAAKWLPLCFELAHKKFCGAIQLSSPKGTFEAIFLGGDVNLVIRDSKLFLTQRQSVVLDYLTEILQDGSSCRLTYFPAKKAFVQSVIALATRTSDHVDKSFANLTDLTNYFLLSSVWNRRSALLVLQVSTRMLCIVMSEGELHCVWDFYNRKKDSSLLEAANFIAENPDAEAAYFDLNPVAD